jgi:hypothetical protein
MEIPAFYASYGQGGVVASDGSFSILSPKKGMNTYGLKDTVWNASGVEVKSPVMIMDCTSFEQRQFSEKVMKNLRLTGFPVWFMTYINTVDDVFDAFNKDAEFVFAPYHFIESDIELRDICDVSDSVVPMIFVHKGKAILPGMRTADVLTVLEKLVGIGFYKNCIVDMRRSLDGYSWSIVSEDYPSTIPFVDDTRDLQDFQTVVTPYLL